MTAIAVAELVERAELGITVISGRAGLSRTVTVPRIQKPGLALTGWPEQLHQGRVLVLGGTEIDYLRDQELARDLGISTMLRSEPACVVVCRGLVPMVELVAAAEHQDVPLLVSALATADFIVLITAWMTNRLAPSMQLHGVLLDVLGIGVLVVGKSGIGKSETALDLVVRGHCLVADDSVLVRRHGNQLSGRGGTMIGHHMEIRGLGIINIKDVFGVSSVRETKVIDLVIELHEWDADVEYERIGVDDTVEKLLDVAVPKLRLPVRPGRNIATLIEVAARNQLLKAQGIHSARAFRDLLHRELTQDPADAGDVVT